MKTQTIRSKIAEQNVPESCEYCKFIRYDSATGDYKCAFAKCAYYNVVEKRKKEARGY